MGFITVEYHIRNVLEEGIARLRENPDELHMVFAELTTGSIGRSLGCKLVEKIEKFFVENDIPVRMAFNANQPELPSITVHMVSSIESPQYKRLGDQGGYTSETIKPAKMSPTFYAKQYDSSTGLVTLPDDFLSPYILPGQPIFSYKDDIAYYIVGTVAEKTFTIVDGNGDIPPRPDLSELVIVSKMNYKNKRIAASVFEETFEIRTYSTSNTDEAIWLYYIASYILFNNKQYFEEVGLHNQIVSSGEFLRDFNKIPNNIWGRFLRLKFIVEHTWLENINTQLDLLTPDQIPSLQAGVSSLSNNTNLTVISSPGGFYLGSTDETKPLISIEDDTFGE